MPSACEGCTIVAVEQDRYSRGAVAFHWTIAALVLVNASLALFRETFGAVAIEMISAHKAIGLAILALSLARLGWRLAHRPPPIGAGLPLWEARLALAVHRLLYAFMIAVPAAGWIFVSLAPDSRPLDWRGGDSVPELPFSKDDGAAFFWHEAHELMGFAMIGLVLLHIAAALRHELPGGARVLSRMLPKRSR